MRFFISPLAKVINWSANPHFSVFRCWVTSSIRCFGTRKIGFSTQFYDICKRSIFIILLWIYPVKLYAYDPRYFFGNFEFLFEETIPVTGDGSLDCLKKSIKTIALAVPPNAFYFEPADIVLAENIFDRPLTHAILFSKQLYKQSYLTPSGETNSIILHYRSLLHKMCPRVQISKYDYDYNLEKSYYHKYIIVRTTD